MSITVVIPKPSEFNANHFAEMVSGFWILSMCQWETEENRMVNINFAHADAANIFLEVLNDEGWIKTVVA